MKRLDLINQIIARKKQINITVENLAKLSGVGVRTINRLLKNEDDGLNKIIASYEKEFLSGSYQDTLWVA